MGINMSQVAWKGRGIEAVETLGHFIAGTIYQ